MSSKIYSAHAVPPTPIVPQQPHLAKDKAPAKGCITTADDRTAKNIAPTHQNGGLDIDDGSNSPESDTSSESDADFSEDSDADETDDTSLEDPEADAIFQETFEPRITVRGGPGTVTKHFGAVIDSASDGNFVSKCVAKDVCKAYGAKRYRSSSIAEEYELANGQRIRVRKFIKVVWMRESDGPKDTWLKSKFYILQDPASGEPHPFDFLIGKPGIKQMGGPAALGLQKLSDRHEPAGQDPRPPKSVDHQDSSGPRDLPVHQDSSRLSWRMIRAKLRSRLKLNQQLVLGFWRRVSKRHPKMDSL